MFPLTKNPFRGFPIFDPQPGCEEPEPEIPSRVFVARAAPGDVAGFSSTKIRASASGGWADVG